MTHGRGQVQYVELGFGATGRSPACASGSSPTRGAYPAVGAFLPFLTRSMSQGVYRIPKVQFNSRSAATNTTATAAYRGAGRPEATHMLERVIDMAADELGIDPVEIRKRNLLPPEAFPLTTVTGANYDVGEYAKALDEATRLAGYEALRAEQRARRERGDVKQLGIGVCAYVEVTAGGLFPEYGAIEVVGQRRGRPGSECRRDRERCSRQGWFGWRGRSWVGLCPSYPWLVLATPKTGYSIETWPRSGSTRAVPHAFHEILFHNVAIKTRSCVERTGFGIIVPRAVVALLPDYRPIRPRILDGQHVWPGNAHAALPVVPVTMVSPAASATTFAA